MLDNCQATLCFITSLSYFAVDLKFASLFIPFQNIL